MTIWHAGASLSGKLVSFATTTSIALMLGAASASAATVVKWMHVELDPKSVAVWEEIAKDFETKHPDVDVQLQFLENEAFKAKLPTLLQSNDVPDFFYSWPEFVTLAARVKQYQPSINSDKANLGEVYSWGKRLLSEGVDLISYMAGVRVPMPKSILQYLDSLDQFSAALAKPLSEH